jgi:hypothetical protein
LCGRSRCGLENRCETVVGLEPSQGHECADTDQPWFANRGGSGGDDLAPSDRLGERVEGRQRYLYAEIALLRRENRRTLLADVNEVERLTQRESALSTDFPYTELVGLSHLRPALAVL